MPQIIGFDNEKYLAQQSDAILERVNRFDNKLYLEFGGKLMYDYHAARVLPGYDSNVKMRLLQKLGEKSEVILCIYAGDIERKKMRADFGITYDSDALRLIDDVREWGINVAAVVITRFDGQPSATLFKNKLERRGVHVYTHRATYGYPTDVDMIVSDEGYGANPYIATSKPIATASILFISKPTTKNPSTIIAMWRHFPFCAESSRKSPMRRRSTNRRPTWE
jgi:uncharacterized protein (UPF0371 family)